MHSNTRISPTKGQIKVALIRVSSAMDLYRVIDKRLETVTVEVKSWFGLCRKEMTQDEHIRKTIEGSFIPYHTRAYSLGYITMEELRICRFVMNTPSIRSLKEWEASERVYLGQLDHKQLIYALTEEFK